MTAPTLESARLKLERALELIDEIRSEYDALNMRARERPVPLTFEISPEVEIVSGRTWHVLRCVELREQPPVRWGLLAGDAMHNARSALDHLACRLVELAGNTPTRRTAFPIWHDDPSGTQRQGLFDATIRGMRPDHQDGIRRLQPYARRGTDESDMLIKLAALDNLDKHTIVLPLLATISERRVGTPSFQALLPGNVEYRWNTRALVAPGVEILRYRELHGHHSIADVELPLHVRATYGDAETGLSELRDIRSYVVGIVESFAPEFSLAH